MDSDGIVASWLWLGLRTDYGHGLPFRFLENGNQSKQARLLVLPVSPFLCFLLLGDEGAADCFSFPCASIPLFPSLSVMGARILIA
jgi:hypothetical protein